MWARQAAIRQVTGLRYAHRPALKEIIPSKKVFNRILFDQDSRLVYSKAMKIYNEVYSKLDTPDEIRLPSYTRSDDLMTLKEVLAVIRKSTSTINTNLVALENELVEQAGELGNNDAIAILAFNTIQDPSTSKEDYQYANKLIEDLSNIKHPLTFKLAGDLAYKKNAFQQAEQYWLQFLDLENDTINASHVYTNVAIYYFSVPDLVKAKFHLEKALEVGQLDATILKAHYYYSQIFTMTDPKLAKYHLEICASKGLKESFVSLGFLEMNVFNNYSKSLEWFKLGHETDGDVTCLIGQFDCFICLKENKNALAVLQRLMSIQEKLNVPNVQATLQTFFRTRKDAVALVQSSSF